MRLAVIFGLCAVCLADPEWYIALRIETAVFVPWVVKRTTCEAHGHDGHDGHDGHGREGHHDDGATPVPR